MLILLYYGLSSSIIYARSDNEITDCALLIEVMAAWDAHRKKVEEGLGLDEPEDMADRRPTLQTTTDRKSVV